MEITLKFNAGQLNVLAQALAELPFKVAAPLMQHIQGQVNSQQGNAAKPTHLNPGVAEQAEAGEEPSGE